jgi:hypothetical protein
MKQDRFLVVILGLIIFLVVIAVGLFFIRKEPQNYGPEDSPGGVVRNFMLALQAGDYQRAYSYLQDGSKKPTFSTFQQSLLKNETQFIATGVQLGEVEIFGDNARVDITIIHNSTDPFDRTWEESATVLLTLQDGKWVITSMPYPYWGWDWYIEK